MTTAWQSTTLPTGIHALVGGPKSGIPVILLPGWPQTAAAFEPLFPQLSVKYRVYALDPPGLGDSEPSPTGYDTKSVSLILHTAVKGVLKPSQKYHLVGHDIGAWIAYSWARHHPVDILSLTLLDSAIPGHAPPLSFPLPDPLNMKLWQFSFNRLPDLPEILTKGKEKELLNWLFATKSVHPDRVTKERREVYVKAYSKEGAMSRGFEYYRAVEKSAAQNLSFKETKLTMPILALGGDQGVAGGLKAVMEVLAESVEGGAIPDCGHYVMEEQPEALAQMMLDFYQSVERS
jgi:pimeloyl-ACP methyl ester carboxylesterase